LSQARGQNDGVAKTRRIAPPKALACP
jgi:hypothetical protein